MAGRHDWTETEEPEPVYFGCGKTSHIQVNCPDKKAKSCAAAAMCIQKEVDTGTAGNVAPMDDAQEGETPPEDEDTESEYFLLSEEDHPQVTPGDDEYPLSPLLNTSEAVVTSDQNCMRHCRRCPWCLVTTPCKCGM